MTTLLLAPLLVWTAPTLTPIQMDRAGPVDPAQTTEHDCGTLALYRLLRLLDNPVPLAMVQAALPDMPRSGFSMRQLRDAAGTLGVSLRGVRLLSDAHPPRTPFLCFLDTSPHGHFAVARPVGHTGTLIQVIDGLEDPLVLDAADFFRKPEWTGLALVPSDRTLPLTVHILAGLVLFLVLVLVMKLVLGLSRRVNHV
jgi:ABC-type bacteriocin/lantibiotic exporter with double-glycine peptidase domain